MPERVYMNRRTGEERIHIEITRDEIGEMISKPAGPAASRFWELLGTADAQFSAGLRDMACQADGRPAPSSCSCGYPDDTEAVHPANGDPCYMSSLAAEEAGA